MAQMRVLTKGSGLQQVVDEVSQDVDSLKRQILTEMASVIANNSPVDSGTYVTEHQVALRSGSFSASKERSDDIPRLSRGEAVDVSRARQQGFENMLGDISGININSTNFVFRNPMLYAGIIEGRDAVYAQARREAAQIIKNAIQSLPRR